MNIVRRIFMGLGAVLAVTLVLTLAAPKTVRAVVSTLVIVSNTTSNPVPTLAAEASRSFVFHLDCSGRSVINCAPVYTVPAGEVAVVETFSSLCQSDTGGESIGNVLNYTAASDPNQREGIFFPPGQITITDAGTVSSLTQNLKIYAGAGSITMAAESVGTLSVDVSCSFTISGYLVP